MGTVRALKTRKGSRQVPLYRWTVDPLGRHRQRQAAERDRWGRLGRLRAGLLPGERGALRPEFVTKHFLKLACRQGCRVFGCATASIALEVGIDVKVSERLGRANTAITNDISRSCPPA